MTFEQLEIIIGSYYLTLAIKNPNSPPSVPVDVIDGLCDRVKEKYKLEVSEEQKKELIEKYSITY